VDGEGALVERDVRLEAAVDRVVLEEVREVVGRDEVVDRDDVQALLVSDAVDQSADAAEPVDADADRHRTESPSRDPSGRGSGCVRNASGAGGETPPREIHRGPASAAL